jgi:hypothetical protein
MKGHGWYERKKPLEAKREVPRAVKIRRWKCKACKRTMSLLPDVFHRYRQYVMEVIVQVLVWRYVMGKTWVKIQSDLSKEEQLSARLEMPSLDSLMRWGAAFVGNVMGWLRGVLMVLATVMPQMTGLDVHGSIEHRQTPMQELLMKMTLLACWLKGSKTGSMPEAELDEIRWIWGWGWNARLGRLV